MKNLTVTVDEDTLQWARIEAAKQGVSLSRMTSDLLRERRAQEAGYDTAMQRFMSRDAAWVSDSRLGYPTRDALYDREVLR